MAPIFPILGLCWGYFWRTACQQSSAVKHCFRYIFLAYVWVEVVMLVKDQQSYFAGDRELYSLLHGRSDLLLDYKNVSDSSLVPTRIESVYITEPYDTPVKLWSHVSDSDKITVLHAPYTNPAFVNARVHRVFKRLERTNHPAISTSSL